MHGLLRLPKELLVTISISPSPPRRETGAWLLTLLCHRLSVRPGADLPPPQAPPPPLPSSDCPLPHSRPGRALGQAPVGTVPQKPSADQGGWAHRDSGCTVWARAGGTQRQRAVKALGMAGARLLCWGGAGGKGIGSQGHSAGSLGGVPSDPPGQRRPRAPDKDLLHSAFLLHPWIFL